MGVKLKYEDIKSIINKEDKLISKEYNNNKELLEIQCGKCNLIYKQNYDTTFNNWFNEYFDILNFDINSNSFDKEKGWGIFKVKNNNYILLYTLEKINNLENELLKLDIKLKSENVADNKIYSKKYKEFKQKIKISDKYKKDLLNTDIMRFFYSDDDIKNMYKKYV